MIPKEIEEAISQFFSVQKLKFYSVSGGSINAAYRFSVQEKDYFLKYNSAEQFPDIIKLEVEGLKAIAETGTISVPEVLLYEELDNYEILVLPYIPQEAPSNILWENLASALAKMHQVSGDYYGWRQDNYIGSLTQHNNKHHDFISFFKEQRLEKQIGLANRAALLSKNDNQNLESLIEKLDQLLPKAQPSLVHGDLWGGNFIAGEGQQPFLIDPSIHYNFRETDLAFTHLFGGFHKRFYEAYQSQLPTAPGFNERIDLYNLYPLLVHLNIFGRSYLSQIQAILRKFA